MLVVIDATEAITEEDRELLSQVRGRAAIVVENKSDLVSGGRGRPSVDDSGQSASALSISTSALTGEGIAELRAAILEHIGGDASRQVESGFLTSVRHQKLVSDSLTSLEAALKAVGLCVPHEMLLLDLYGALRPLDEITGATTSDDILNLIFGTFCIGK